MNKISDSIVKFLGLDGLIQNVTGYVEARVELMKVEIREDMGKVIAKSLVFVVLFFMAFLFLIFFSIGLAQFLNGYFTHPYAGYWTVAGFYLATFLILLVFRESIHNYIERQLSELIKHKKSNHGTAGDTGSGKEKAH